MKIGIFADTHDHLDHLKCAVELFNREECELVLFAGDFVSPIVGPTLRKLNAKFAGCFGDNEGNKRGLQGGLRVVGPIAEPPFGLETPDGVKILVTHILGDLQGEYGDADVVVFAHTHKPGMRQDETGRLFVNPGETSGWSFRNPTVALLETQPLQARIVPLTMQETTTAESVAFP